MWRFETRTAAFLHPLVQFGDALLCGPEDVSAQYNRVDWHHARRLAGLGDVPAETTTPAGFRRVQELQAPDIFRALERAALAPPQDPQVICSIVAQDRRTGTMAKKKETAPAPTAVVTPGPAAVVAAEATPRPVVTRGPKGVSADAVIRMCVDTHGKHYGPDNNPKKPGSKTHGRFALYTDGMTIAQALEAGIPTSDMVYDQGHGFIKYGTATASGTTKPDDDDGGEGDEGVEDEDSGEDDDSDDDGRDPAPHHEDQAAHHHA